MRGGRVEREVSRRELSENSRRRESERKIISIFEVVSSLVSATFPSSLGFLIRRVLVLYHHGEKACGSRYPLGRRHQWVEGVHD